MKKTYRITILSILLLGTSYNLSAQDIIDELSQKLCDCIEKQNVKDPTEMGPCFEDLLINNLKEIKKQYNAETIDDLDMDVIGNKIGAKMVKECPYVLDNFPSGNDKNQKKVTKQSDLKCDNLKNGNFYYLSEIPKTGIVDTTFITISNDMYLERMKNGRSYALLNIKWKDNCEFDLTFKESNDPMKKELSKPGDVYEYKILLNGNESLYIETTWMERNYQFELFKIK